VAITAIMTPYAAARAQTAPSEVEHQPVTTLASPTVAGAETPIPTPFVPEAYLHRRALVRQTLLVDELRGSRRRWKPSAVALASGITTVALGSVFLVQSWNMDSDDYDANYNLGLGAAGILMVPIGLVITTVTAPLLGVRAARTRRLAHAERDLAEMMR
jgi:hypothetical protein